MEDVAARMTARCTAEACTFNAAESEDIQSLAVLAMRITAIADVADTKMCLPEVFEEEVETDEFKERFLASAVSEEARNRFSLAFRELNTAQTIIDTLRG